MTAAGVLGGATAAHSLLRRRIIPARPDASAVVDETILRDERSRDNRGSANSAARFDMSRPRAIGLTVRRVRRSGPTNSTLASWFRSSADDFSEAVRL
jgi:hypothetical protein